MNLAHTLGAWISAHPVEALTLAAAIASAFRSAWRRLSPDVHARYPRLGHLADLLGALWPDIEPAARALVAMALGLPYPPQASPPPRASQAGRARVGDLVAIVGALVVILAVHGCPQQPAPDGGPASTPTGWVTTAETISTSLAVALPLMEAGVPLVAHDFATAARVTASLEAARTVALPRFNAALATYQREASASSLCAARAATDALVLALEGVADTVGALGWGLAPDVDLALSGLGGILDGTVGAGCAMDASTGATLHARRAALPPSLRPWPVVAGGHR